MSIFDQMYGGQQSLSAFNQLMDKQKYEQYRGMAGTGTVHIFGGIPTPPDPLKLPESNSYLLLLEDV